ncbi:MAG: aminoacyl-tRNA hydrolase [Candidatus Omnitrophica bacterium]|nr:aminoacyl-tRNA hydrolase [Candidatus Omnitrophota bacterium]
MKLIVGLGNPGKTYADNRHNVGFLIVKTLAAAQKVSLKHDARTSSLTGKFKIYAEQVVLALPFTFMNLSGVAVKALVKKYKIGPDDLLVVCDDLDLEFGRLKLRASGSSGGHNGLESIIEHLGSSEFARLRLGIGRPAPHQDAAEYVLEDFGKKEKAEIEEINKEAAQCCLAWLREGTAKCMNIYNRTPRA